MNSVTFSGSLGEFVRELRGTACLKNRWALIRIFPDVEYGSSVSGDFESLAQYYKSPECLFEFVRKGLIRINLPFFDSKIPDLEKVLCALYPENPGAVDILRQSFNILYGELRKCRQYFNLSRRGEGEREITNEDIDRAVIAFNDSLPTSSKQWKIPLENSDASCSPEERNWKITFPWPLEIRGFSKNQDTIGLIDYAERWKNYLRNRPKSGRPPKPFNVLLFHVVNAFTFRVLDAKRNYIEKGKMLRVRKNWQLVCAALFWLHANKEIPEMKKFIHDHEDEEAGAALKKFVAWAKREYSHFRESGKGQGKFGFYFPRGEAYLGIPLVYVTEKTLEGRLV